MTGSSAGGLEPGTVNEAVSRSTSVHLMIQEMKSIESREAVVM